MFNIVLLSTSPHEEQCPGSPGCPPTSLGCPVDVFNHCGTSDPKETG